MFLVKPQSILIPALLEFFAPKTRPRKKLLILSLLFIVAAVVAIPWTARNWRDSGRFIPVSTNGGFNLFVGNNPWACGSYFFNDEMRRQLGIQNEYAARTIVQEWELDRKAASLARRFVFTHPLQTLKLIPLKLWALYAGDVDGFYYQGTPDGKDYQGAGLMKGAYLALAIFAQLYYMALLALFAAACVGDFIALRRGRPRLIPPVCLAMIGYFTLLTIIFFGIMRYHYPILPWIVIAGSAWLARLPVFER